MAQSEILGLFTTPEQYQQMQQMQQRQMAADYAGRTPQQQVRYGAYSAGQRFGGGLAGALGAQDPQLRIIAQRQALSKQIDPADPESIMKAANIAAQGGDQQFAMTLAEYARKAQSEMALATQRSKEGRAAATPKELQVAAARAQLQDQIAQMEAMEPSPERDRALAVAKNTLAGLAPAGEKVPEKIAIANEIIKTKQALYGLKLRGVDIGPEGDNLRDKLKFLQGVEKTPSFGTDRESIAAEMFGKPFAEITQQQKAAVNKRVEAEQGSKARASAPSITNVIENKGQTAFSEQLGKLDAKQVADALSTRDNSIAALNTLNRLNQLDNQGLISGSYASGRVGATNLLNTLGLVSPADSQRLASSENYQKAAGDLVLAALGGKLGAGFSNEDRAFINGLVPQLENSPQARKQLIQFMTRKNQDIVNETTRLEEYARQNNGLKGFKPKIPLAPAATSELSNMTDAQLKAAIAAKRVKAK